MTISVDNTSQTHHIVDDVFCSELAKLDNHLSSGAYGIVTLESLREWPPTLNIEVRRTVPRRNVAVKRFTGYENGEFVMEAGVKELKYLKRVARHPSFVQILGILYQSPEEREVPLGYTMNFLSEGTLSNVIYGIHPRDDYGYSRILDWLRQAAEALRYLHGLGIIHCDVKPDNILMTNNHRSLILCDLGSCQPANEMREGGVGTYYYMSPEIMAQSVMYTELSDVYSLAITVWEMHHRTTPYSDDDMHVFAIVKKVREVHHRPVISEDCNLNLRNIIESAWSPNPSDRPSMIEVEEFAVNELRLQGFHPG